MPGELPDARHRAGRSAPTTARRGARRAAVRLQGRGPVRPDHRGRPADRCRLRAVHDRVQRLVHEVRGPRRDVVGAGQDLGNVSWNDKPILAVSDDGREVYASFNGPTGGDPWIARSGDAGATWTQVKIIDSGRYVYAFDGDVAADGTVYFAESSLLYGNARQEGTARAGTRGARVHLARPRRDLDRQAGRDRPARSRVRRAPAARPTSTPVTRRSRRMRMARWSSSTTRRRRSAASSRSMRPAPPTVAAPGRRRSVISTASEESTTPMVESRGSGDVRMAWAQTSGGGNVDAWNTWYRRSTDGGATWSAPVRISDATSGAPLQVLGRLCRGLWRLRRDRDHERRQDHRDVGRRHQLHGPRRRLGQPGALASRARGRSAPSGEVADPLDQPLEECRDVDVRRRRRGSAACR